MKKDKVELTEDEELQAKAQAAIKLAQDLPASSFAAVPDEDIVTLEVSGQFGRVLNRVLEYLYQSEPEEEVTAAANQVKNNFEDMDQEDVTLHAISLWAISNLLADFSVQAGIQNKTKIYDKDKIMTRIFSGVTSDEPLKPLTKEELKERQKEEKKKAKEKVKANNQYQGQQDEARDKRRAHRDAQRFDEDNPKLSSNRSNDNKPIKNDDED